MPAFVYLLLQKTGLFATRWDKLAKAVVSNPQLGTLPLFSISSAGRSFINAFTMAAFRPIAWTELLREYLKTGPTNWRENQKMSVA